MFVKRLKDAGITEPQAEAMSYAFKEAQAASYQVAFNRITALTASSTPQRTEQYVYVVSSLPPYSTSERNLVSISELATKADLKELELRINAKIDKINFDIKLYFIILLCVMLITNPKALELISKILGIVK
jgi:hypothetical protein